LGQTPPYTEVRAYDLSSGAKKASSTFPAPAFCNDLAVDPSGNLFVSDSFGSVYKLAHGSSTLTQWNADPMLKPAVANGFGANGIVFDSQGMALFVNTNSGGHLLRIPVNADGSAGTAVAITVTPALQTPDGMRLVDATTLILVDGTAGQLVKIALSGTTATATPIATGLNGPTSVVQIANNYYVSEGQLGYFTGQLSGSPSLPFDVRVIASH
jgi:sugar lactone lactonase YvrE